MPVTVEKINEANVGYLPAIVLKEIKANRKCEIAGGICRTVINMEDYNRVLPQMKGKFGEVIGWTPSRTAMVATRAIPGWAIPALEEALKTCPEMERWLM